MSAMDLSGECDLLWLLDGDAAAEPALVSSCVASLGAALTRALDLPHRSSSSRAEVASGTPRVDGVPRPLDPEPDVRETLRLADDLDLDELVALVYLIRGCDAVRTPLPKKGVGGGSRLGKREREKPPDERLRAERKNGP